MDYRISDLKNFITAAQHRTISEAARVIGISQPALSESLKRLEKDLKRVLFFRTRQGITLSPEGRSLLPVANKLLTDMASLDATQRPRIRIGAHSIVAAWAIPQLVEKLTNEKTEFYFDISHGLSREIQNKIQSGLIDIGIVVNPLNADGLVSKQIATDEVTIWAAKTLKKPSILFCDTNLIQTQQILKKWQFKNSVEIIESTSLEFIARMVKAGVGMGILPSNSLGPEPLRRLRVINNAPTHKDSIHLMYQVGFGRTAYERSFVKALNCLTYT